MSTLSAISVYSRRLVTWGLICLTLLGGLLGLVAALPCLAPQFVIAHSPWIWPVLRAEAYETQGEEWDPNNPIPVVERNNLLDRLLNEEHWDEAAIPILTRALDHPDLSMRRTAVKTLLILLGHNWSTTPAIKDTVLAAHLRRLLDDPDDAVFTYAMDLLVHHEDGNSAQAVLAHLPRSCGLLSTHRTTDWNFRFCVFWGTIGEPHPLRFLRLAPVVERSQLWLATGDPEMIRLALMVLGHTDDAKALPLLDAHLGKHVETDEPNSGWDPVSYALSLSTLAGVDDLLLTAMADPDPVRRRSAAGALGGRNDKGSIDAPLALLRAHIDDVDGGVRYEVAIGLVEYPLEQTLPDISRIIAAGGRPAVVAIDRVYSTRRFLHRSRPWWGQGDVGPVINRDTPENWALEARIIAEFSTLTRHPEPAVRFELARYLCSTWEADTERVLRSMADDPDPQVRAEIAAELHAITTRTRRAAETHHRYHVPVIDPAPTP